MFVKSKLKNLIYFGLNRLKPLWPANGRWVTILMYHSIGENAAFFTVRPENFRWQMNYLKENGYQTVFLAKLASWLSSKSPLSAKTVVLTFDDGYQDIYNNAFPVLREHGLKATTFLATDFIGGVMNNRNNAPLEMLSWQQIEEMHQSGLVDFQPHSSGHYDLDRVALDEAERQILRSRELIESKLNKSCKFFAYPRGKYNPKLMGVIKRNGFEAALTVKEGIVMANQDLFELRRNSIDSSTAKEQFIGKIGYSVELFNKTFRWRR